MLVSRNVVSVSDTSAVNLMVGWWLFACSMDSATSSLFIFQIEKISSNEYTFSRRGVLERYGVEFKILKSP